MAEFEKMPPLALARALIVARRNCREQEKLIRTLIQDINQEEIMKLPEACYCCRRCDRPCLQNISTKGVPLYKPDLGENPQSPLVLPPIAPKEVNNHLMGILAQANKPPKNG